jgi:hypothetical protein
MREKGRDKEGQSLQIGQRAFIRGKAPLPDSFPLPWQVRGIKEAVVKYQG